VHFLDRVARSASGTIAIGTGVTLQRAVPITPADRRVLVSITSPFTRPSPHFGRVGIRIMDFEACSGFTHVTARWIARPPEAAFVTRLRPVRLPVRAARQLPDQSTTLWAEPSSTSDTRLRGAPKRSQFHREAQGGLHIGPCQRSAENEGLRITEPCLERRPMYNTSHAKE
jgi:hypothetical protein